MISEQKIFYDYLETRRLKRTAQRDLILDMFLKIEKHITPEDLYQRIKKKYPHIGFSTVYRTLKLLVNCGLARELKTTGDTSTLFEHLYEHPHHDHLICQGCGKLVEFYDKAIEDLQEKVAKIHGFKMTAHRLEITGLCGPCQDKGAKG